MEERYFRIYIYIPATESKAFAAAIAQSQRILSARFYSYLRAHRDEFESVVASGATVKRLMPTEVAAHRIKLFYIPEYETEYMAIKQQTRHPGVRDLLRQIAVYGIISPEHSLVGKLCRNSTYTTGRKRQSSKPHVESAQRMELLASLSGKKNPRLLFATGKETELYTAVCKEVSSYAVGKRESLLHGEYDWSLVPLREYPSVIQDSACIEDLRFLLRQINPALAEG